MMLRIFTIKIMMVGLLHSGVLIVKINNSKLVLIYKIIPADSLIVARGGHKEIVKFLMSNGADIHHKSNDCSTALMIGFYYWDK